MITSNVPQPTKKRVLTRKAHGADVRGAGLWPTGVHEAPWNAAREVPQLTKMQVLAGKASGGAAYWTYVSLPRTQPARFCWMVYPMVTLVTLAFWRRLGTFTVSTPSLSTAVRPAVSASLR